MSTTTMTTKEQPSNDSPPPPPQPFEIAVVRKLEALSSSLRETFLRLDLDRDGYVTRSDLKTSLHNVLGIDLTREQMDAIFLRFAYFEDDRRDFLQVHPDASIRDCLPGVKTAADTNTNNDTKASVRAHGIRYQEFVRYIDATARALVPSSTECSFSLRAPSAESALLPIIRTPEIVASNLKHTLHKVIEAHTRASGWSGGMPVTALFLQMDTHRSGRVTVEEFRAWVENIGWKLNDSQLQDILGEFYQPEGVGDGICLKVFSKILESLEDMKDKSSIPTNESLCKKDSNDVSPNHGAITVAREHFTEAIHQCVDDAKTDHDIIYNLQKQLYRKQSKMLDAFQKIDLDGSGQINVQEFSEALHQAGLDVSEERAEGLLRKFDRDGDGRLGKGEFVRLMQYSVTVTPGSSPQVTNATRTDARVELATGNDSQRELLVAAVIGHEDEDFHRDVITDRLDDSDIAIIMSFREALFAENTKMRKIFQVLDTDGTQSLDMEQLKSGFEGMGIEVDEEHVEHIIKMFDTERTGKLKYYQFVKLISSNLQ